MLIFSDGGFPKLRHILQILGLLQSVSFSEFFSIKLSERRDFSQRLLLQEIFLQYHSDIFHFGFFGVNINADLIFP